MNVFLPSVLYWIEHRCVISKLKREKASVLFADYIKFIPKMEPRFDVFATTQKMFSMVLKSLYPNYRIGGFSYFYNISLAH